MDGVVVKKIKLMAKAKKAEKKDQKESIKIALVKVFDKKSNRQRELAQEEIDIEPTRYRLR